MFVYDSLTGERRPATGDDWLAATRLIDALDEVGVYWEMVKPASAERSAGDLVAYWRGNLPPLFQARAGLSLHPRAISLDAGSRADCLWR